MQRIQDQGAGARSLAKDVLLWITLAKRPLTPVELQHATAVESGEPKLDNQNISDIEYILSVCAGLVMLDKESDIICLVHYTTHEYFE